MLTITSQQWNEWIGLLVFPLTRILALVATVPLLGDREVPLPVRIGLSLMLTLLIAPSLPEIRVNPASATGMLMLAQQILIGALLGFSIRLVFAAVTTAGEMIGLQMGLGFASFYDPQNASFQPLLAQFLSTLLSLIFLSMDGQLQVIAALADSFHQLPLVPGELQAASLQTYLQSAAHLFMDALQMALPLLATLVIANIALGLLTRSAPQLNLFAVGFPITLGLGLVALVLVLPNFRPLEERAIHLALAQWGVLLQQLLGR